MLQLTLLELPGKELRTRRAINWLRLSRYGNAIAPAPVSRLTFQLQAMMLYPLIQQKAQAHIDVVVGVERMPDPSDVEKLPYVRQVMKETLRCKTTITAAGIRPRLILHRAPNSDGRCHPARSKSRGRDRRLYNSQRRHGGPVCVVR